MNLSNGLIELDWELCDGGYEILPHGELSPGFSETPGAENVDPMHDLYSSMPHGDSWDEFREDGSVLIKSGGVSFRDGLAELFSKECENAGSKGFPMIVSIGYSHSTTQPFANKAEPDAILIDFLNADTDETMLAFCNKYGNPFRRSAEAFSVGLFQLWRALAVHVVDAHMNRKYDDLVNLLFDRQLTTTVDIRMKRVPNRPTPQFSLVPHSVLRGIWLLLMQQIAGNLDFRKCQWCGSLFTVAPTSNRVYDKGKCRVAAHRAAQSN